jgi:hypothetical protein
MHNYVLAGRLQLFPLIPANSRYLFEIGNGKNPQKSIGLYVRHSRIPAVSDIAFDTHRASQDRAHPSRTKHVAFTNGESVLFKNSGNAGMMPRKVAPPLAFGIPRRRECLREGVKKAGRACQVIPITG